MFFVAIILMTFYSCGEGLCLVGLVKKVYLLCDVDFWTEDGVEIWLIAFLVGVFLF